MRKNEVAIMSVLDNGKTYTRKELFKLSKIKNDSTFATNLKALCNDGFVDKKGNVYCKTGEVYDPRDRGRKHQANAKYVFNKVFTGKYLQNSLGYEIINFIIDDENTRYIYMNPWGNKCQRNPEYVFHIVETSRGEDGQVYELAAISEIDDNRNVNHIPSFFDKKYSELFDDSEEVLKKTKYGVSYVARNFYVPKKRILFKFKGQESEIKNCNGYIYITLKCNPQHHSGYCEREDETRIDELFKQNCFVIHNAYNVDLKKISLELPFAVLSGRVGLEVSMSNLIAYFMMRDKNLCATFVGKFLGLSCGNETFSIIREQEKHIDILLKGEKSIIVIENKIDSDINGVTNLSDNDKKIDSQLDKYYEYVSKKYQGYQAYYYILVPEYSPINENYLNKYQSGDKYVIKTYNNLYKAIRNYDYFPNGKEATDEQRYLFDQFVKTIEYLTWSKAKQMENTAYIRLRQKI